MSKGAKISRLPGQNNVSQAVSRLKKRSGNANTVRNSKQMKQARRSVATFLLWIAIGKVESRSARHQMQVEQVLYKYKNVYVWLRPREETAMTNHLFQMVLLPLHGYDQPATSLQGMRMNLCFTSCFFYLAFCNDLVVKPKERCLSS